MIDIAKLNESKIIGLLSQTWPLIAAGTYVFGLSLLNLFYYIGWGFTDLGFSTALCTAATLIVFLTVLFVIALRFLGKTFITWLENSRPTTRRGFGAVLFAYAAYSALGIFGVHIYPTVPVPSFQIPADLGRFLIALVWYSVIVYVLMIVVAVWPARNDHKSRIILPSSISRSENTDRWRRLLLFCSRLLLIPVFLTGIGAGFFDIYDAIPSRWGGGNPDPLLLWVSPSDLPIINAVRWDQPDPVCPGASIAVY